MNFLDILLIAVGLSMDAFAVSIGKGMAVPRANWRNALCVGIWFGGFQGLMPIIGFMLVSIFSNIPAIGNAISRTDHWIAFLMLALIGGNMIKEALSSKEEQFDDSFAARAMAVLAVATSIDALATGGSFACLDKCATLTDALMSDIWLNAGIIALTTFAFSAVGLLIGNVVGRRFHKGAEIFGGVVLISIGLKILLEHLLA